MERQRTKRRIGVIGGMGPEATVLLMARVIAMTSASDDSDHVAMIVDNNTQVPSRIKSIIEKNGEDPGPVLADMARRLKANGAEALAMPCNTAHYFASVIEGAVDIPLLNMVELTATRIASLDLENKRVGLLASPAVRSTKVFEQAFSCHQIETLYPADQDPILNAIRAVKINSNSDVALRTLEDTSRELVAKGANILLVACSELSIIADAIPDSFIHLDTINILSEEIIHFSGAKPSDVNDACLPKRRA